MEEFDIFSSFPPSHTPKQPRPPKASNPANRSLGSVHNFELPGPSGIAPPSKRKIPFPRNRKPNSKVPKTSHPTVDGERKSNSKLAGLYERHFPVWIENIGIVSVSNAIFKSLKGRDYKMGEFVTVELLTYVTVLSWWNRIVQCGLEYGYNINSPDISILKQATRGIYLPNISRRYVDSIGSYKLTSGAEIVPHVPDIMGSFPNILTPGDVLRQAGRPVPPGPWSIDYEWIQTWNTKTLRSTRYALGFALGTQTFEGRAEFSCSYEHAENGRIVPYAPLAIPEDELDLGAAFMYRNHEAREDWRGEYDYLVYRTHTGESFNLDQFLSDRVNACVVQVPAPTTRPKTSDKV